MRGMGPFAKAKGFDPQWAAVAGGVLVYAWQARMAWPMLRELEGRERQRYIGMAWPPHGWYVGDRRADRSRPHWREQAGRHARRRRRDGGDRRGRSDPHHTRNGARGIQDRSRTRLLGNARARAIAKLREMERAKARATEAARAAVRMAARVVAEASKR